MNKKQYMIKKLSAAFMAVLLLVGTIYAKDLEKGIYSATNTVTHDNPVGQGMARNYTESSTQVEVTAQGTYVTLGFNNTQYMGEFAIKVDGSSVSYEVVSNENNIKKLKFKVSSTDSKITVGMHVIPMDTDVEYTVTLDQSSLKLVKKTEEAVTPQPSEKPSNNAPSNTTKPNNNGQTNTTKPSSNNTSQAVVKPNNTASSSVAKPNNNAQTNAAKPSSSNNDSQVATKPNKEQTNTEASAQVETTQKAEEEKSEDAQAQETVPAVDEEQEENIKEDEALAETTEELETATEDTDTKDQPELIVEGADLGTEEKKTGKGYLVGIAAVVILAAGAGYYWFKMKKGSGK